MTLGLGSGWGPVRAFCAGVALNSTGTTQAAALNASTRSTTDRMRVMSKIDWSLAIDFPSQGLPSIPTRVLHRREIWIDVFCRSSIPSPYTPVSERPKGNAGSAPARRG